MPRYINIHPLYARVHDGEVNIPEHTCFGVDYEGFIYTYTNDHERFRICLETSERAYKDFAYDEDGHGEERKDLINSIHGMRRVTDKGEQFEVFFNDDVCMRYKKHPNNMDEWSWDRAKVHKASIDDLKHIAYLTSRMVKYKDLRAE